ncbi:hypothetical protein ACRAWG_16490 [Methylobacterium sp. P31]
MKGVLSAFAVLTLMSSATLAAEAGAAAGAATGGAVGGPVGAAVGAGVGDAATGPDRRGAVVDHRSGGCSHTTVHKENEVGDSKTVRREDCD